MCSSLADKQLKKGSVAALHTIDYKNTMVFFQFTIKSQRYSKSSAKLVGKVKTQPHTQTEPEGKEPYK